MNNFLHNVCQDIYTKHKNIFKETIIVFPNKRAGVFFKKHLEDVVKETIWLPKVTTLNEFIEELSGMQKDDNMSLIFKLYHIYKGHTKTEESFDDFYYWGEMLLNDFDDIDKYLVDAKDLFKNLKSLKFIDFTIKDELSGIKSYQGEIDNKWVLFEFDKKKNRLFYTFDKNRLQVNKKHKLNLVVKDAVGNIGTYSCSFTW